MNRTISTKEFKSIEDQINLLQNVRKLKIKNVLKAKEHLLSKNYFDLINGFETLVLKDKNDKNQGYITRDFNDFVYLYEFDKKLSQELLAAIATFEIKLKTSIAYHFSKAYCSTPDQSLEYINDSNYYLPPQNALTQRELYLNTKFSEFVLFKRFNYNGLLQTYIDKQKGKYPYINRYGNPPLWIVIKTLMFNDVFIMLNYLKTPEIKLVLADFGYDMQDKKAFLNSVEIIKELRNDCAHFQLVNRFRTPGRLPINNHLVTKLKLNLKSGARFRISLFDTIKVINQFVKTKKIIKVVTSFSLKMRLKNKKKIAIKVLDRMGESNIKVWKKMLKN